LEDEYISLIKMSKRPERMAPPEVVMIKRKANSIFFCDSIM